jgi:hypothetical protein
VRSDGNRLVGLVGSGGVGSGVDVGADESLTEDWEEAALGLLTYIGASVDESVDAGGGDRS